ncbi:excisionase family DNA binding domain [Enterococcus casseliflavus]|nr:excisionase family DNA binding domain [Enterococcus casseliflavus]
MKDYYTVEEVAEKLGVTTRTIRNYQKTNQLKGTKIGGQWRFSYKDVASLMGEPFEDPLLSFASIRSEKQIPESLLAIDFFIESEELLQQQKKSLLMSSMHFTQGKVGVFTLKKSTQRWHDLH